MSSLPLAPDFTGRVLVRGVNWLGDAVMTTPALQRLREALPRAHIALLTHRKLAPLWLDQKAVSQVLTFQPDDGLLGVARRLREGRFDLGLALPNSHRSALELRLAGIPCRIGLAAPFRTGLFTHPVPRHPSAVGMRKRKPNEARRLFASNARPESPPTAQAHQINHYLHLVAAAGANPTPTSPRLEIAPEALQGVRAKFGLNPETLWLGLNPGAEYGPAKRWPAERFAAAALLLQHHLGCRCVLFGGATDVETARQIEARLISATQTDPAIRPPVNLAGKTNLRELCGALKCCTTLITNDTGPMHVAAALDVPVVVPFGSTSPELTGPGLPGDPRHRLLRHPVPCSPCFMRSCPMDTPCLKNIAITEVVQAVQAIVSAHRD